MRQLPAIAVMGESRFAMLLSLDHYAWPLPYHLSPQVAGLGKLRANRRKQPPLRLRRLIPKPVDILRTLCAGRHPWTSESAHFCTFHVQITRHALAQVAVARVCDIRPGWKWKQCDLLLHILTISHSHGAARPHLRTWNFGVCFGASVWIANCITIDFPESPTGSRSTRFSDTKCYQPATSASSRRGLVPAASLCGLRASGAQ